MLSDFIKKTIDWSLETIKKFYKKNLEKKDIKNDVPASITDLIPMPTKDEFLEDEISLSLIADYKNEYLEKLKTKRTITSIDITDNNNQDIYLEILMNLCSINNSDVSFTKIKSIPNKKLELKIKVLKLKYYLEDIRNIIREAKLHVIALNEILTEQKLSKNKRNALINEINNLLHSLLRLKNQELASIKEIFNYLQDIDTVRVKEVLENNKLDITNEEIENRLLEVLEMARLVIPEKVNTLKNIYLDSLELIAKLEQELEIYVYLNRDIINDLKSKVISEEEVKELELLFKIFSVYGRNLVTKEDLRKVYEVKFRVITKDIFSNVNFKIPDNLTFTELECYQDIIFKKINNLLSIENPLKLEHNSLDKREVMDLFERILKTDEEFSWDEILNNRMLLAFLLSFDYTNSLDKFFHELMVKKCDYDEVYFYDRSLNNNDMCFSWNDIIPFASVLEMLVLNRLESGNNTNYIISSGIDFNYKKYIFYELYELHHNHKSRAIYRLPEGIKYINWDETPKELLKVIKDKVDGKWLYTPNTLKVMKGDRIFNNIHYIYFNDGLEILSGKMPLSSNKISLPGTLKVLSWECFNFEKLRELEIRDYEDSCFLNNDTVLREFIKSNYECFKDTYRLFESDEGMTSYQNYSGLYKPVLLENGKYQESVSFRFVSKLSDLVLRDKKGYIIRLDRKYLMYSPFKEAPTTTEGPFKLTDEEVEKLMPYLKRVIESKKPKVLKIRRNK